MGVSPRIYSSRLLSWVHFCPWSLGFPMGPILNSEEHGSGWLLLLSAGISLSHTPSLLSVPAQSHLYDPHNSEHARAPICPALHCV